MSRRKIDVRNNGRVEERESNGRSKRHNPSGNRKKVPGFAFRPSDEWHEHKDDRPLKMGTIDCPETSVKIHHYSLHNKQRNAAVKHEGNGYGFELRIRRAYLSPNFRLPLKNGLMEALINMSKKVKVKQFHYRPEQAQRVPGG